MPVTTRLEWSPDQYPKPDEWKRVGSIMGRVLAERYGGPHVEKELSYCDDYEYLEGAQDAFIASEFHNDGSVQAIMDALCEFKHINVREIKEKPLSKETSERVDRLVGVTLSNVLAVRSQSTKGNRATALAAEARK